MTFQCGFVSQSYFGKVFKRYENMSPLEYKKSVQKLFLNTLFLSYLFALYKYMLYIKFFIKNNNIGAVAWF